MPNALAFLALITAAGFVLTRRSSSEPVSSAPVGSPVPLFGGVPYLFIVRLDRPEAEAAAVLEPKDVEGLEFSNASTVPFWVQPGEGYSTRVAAFRKTLAGNSTLSLGDSFYGIGRLEKLVRLDGQPFSEPLV